MVNSFASRWGAILSSSACLIPLNSTFKQYEFSDGIDVAAVSGIAPETGSGAWKIAGGQNGGSLLDALTDYLGPMNKFLSTLLTGLEDFLKRVGELLKNDVLPSVKGLAKRNSCLSVQGNSD